MKDIKMPVGNFGKVNMFIGFLILAVVMLLGIIYQFRLESGNTGEEIIIERTK